MASRTTFSDLTPSPLPGGGSTGLMRQYSERFKTLFDASALPLTSVGGTANAVTATLDPALDGGGLVDGMKFEITWAAANTAGVTLALNGGSAIAVLDAAGAALIAGSIGTGLRSLLEYIGGSFRVLSPLLSSLGGGSARYYWQFTANGTWNKPAGLDDDTMVTVEGWGPGGGGGTGTGSGGGGGGYSMQRFRLGDLPTSVSVVVPAGGAVNNRSGNTTFGALLTAYAGGAGNGSGAGSGGGGGELSQGGNSTGAAEGAGGGIGGGPGGANPANDARTLWGGGGGGGGANPGGWAVFGGGGGSGASVGGQSLRGGNGGNSGIAGTAPGGGGGRNAPGARGEIRVWI